MQDRRAERQPEAALLNVDETQGSSTTSFQAAVVRTS